MIKSFSYIFTEKAFKQFFMLFIFVLASNVLTNLASIIEPGIDEVSIWYSLVLIFGYMVMFVPYGYSIDLLRENMLNKENPNVLEMDIFKNFKSGFKVVVAGMLLVACLSILFLALGFINRTFLDQFGLLGSSFVFTLIILIFLIMSFLMIAMCCRYVIKPSWLNFLQIKKAALLINNNVAQYFKVYLIAAAAMILLGIITILSAAVMIKIGFIGFVLYNLIVSLMWTYLTFVFAKLFAYSVELDKI